MYFGLAIVSFALAFGLALLSQHYKFRTVELPLFLFAAAVTDWFGGPAPMKTPGRGRRTALSTVREEFTPGGAQVRIFVTGKPKSLKPEVQEQIYQIGREALVNAMRHSRASVIETEVEYLPRRLRVVVRDNGCGMDPEVVQYRRDRHWGLVGMRERAESIGARLRIWSRPKAGTEVEISVPRNLFADAYARA